VLRPRVVLALILAAQLSCVSPGAQPGSDPADHPDSAKVALLAPATDLSGGWATGSDNEPPPGPVIRYPSCAYNPAVWLIEQSGNMLKTWEFPESFNQGIVRADARPARVAPTPGTISGSDVLIADADSKFVLRHDPESGHLRGTRNGAPFWAARQKIIRTEACPGIP
jgi:hypothetical protein